MKKPREAPTFASLLSKLAYNDSRNFAELFSKLPVVTANDRYLHWDELLHRLPPEGLKHEQWWLLLKSGRQSQRQLISLKDKSGAAFSYVLLPPVPQTLHDIDMKAGGAFKMPEPVVNPESKDEYYVSSLIEEAITSSQLEGATTTRLVAKEMLRTGRAPIDRSEQMILNNYLTMRRISSLKDEPLSKDLIFEIHRLMTDETLDDPSAAGRFRNSDEDIGVYDRENVLLYSPPPASELESRLQALCEFANQDTPFVHPVIRSIILHFMLAYEHPFVDGNGRTARALFYWSMLRHQYWLVEYISISNIMLKARGKYGRAFLHTETDEADLTYFILHHLKVVTRALATLHEYIAHKTHEIRQFEAELQGIEILNHRQRGVIRHAVRHPGKHYTVEEHRRTHNISYETARSDLLDLSKRDLFVAKRVGKRWIFTPQIQLTGRLAALGSRGGTLLV